MSGLEHLLGLDVNTASVRRAEALAEADHQLLRRLVQIRKEAGLTQQQVADLLGITQASVANFERYDNDPKLSSVRRYAHAVGALVTHIVEPDAGHVEPSSETLDAHKEASSGVGSGPLRAKPASPHPRPQAATSAEARLVASPLVQWTLSSRREMANDSNIWLEAARIVESGEDFAFRSQHRRTAVRVLESRVTSSTERHVQALLWDVDEGEPTASPRRAEAAQKTQELVRRLLVVQG